MQLASWLETHSDGDENKLASMESWCTNKDLLTYNLLWEKRWQWIHAMLIEWSIFLNMSNVGCGNQQQHLQWQFERSSFLPSYLLVFTSRILHDKGLKRQPQWCCNIALAAQMDLWTSPENRWLLTNKQNWSSPLPLSGNHHHFHLSMFICPLCHAKWLILILSYLCP